MSKFTIYNSIFFTENKHIPIKFANVMLKKYFLDNFLFTAMAGASLSAFFQLVFIESFSLQIFLVVFSFVWTFYVYLNYKIPGVKNKNSILILPILALIFFYDHIPKGSLWLFFCLGVLAINYPKNKFWNGFRSIKYAKVFLIPFIWSSILVLPILFNVKLTNTIQIAFLWLICFVFFFILALLFDIRDAKIDKELIETIPTKVGLEKSKIVALLATIISFSLICFGYISNYFGDSFFYPFILANLYLYPFILLSKANRNTIFYSFWVEAAIFLPFLIYWLVNCLKLF